MIYNEVTGTLILDDVKPLGQDPLYEQADRTYRLATMPPYFDRKAFPRPFSDEDNE